MHLKLTSSTQSLPLLCPLCHSFASLSVPLPSPSPPPHPKLCLASSGASQACFWNYTMHWTLITQGHPPELLPDPQHPLQEEHGHLLALQITHRQPGSSHPPGTGDGLHCLSSASVMPPASDLPPAPSRLACLFLTPLWADGEPTGHSHLPVNGTFSSPS